MDIFNSLPAMALALIAIASVLTGPALGLWSPPATESQSLGEGAADVTVRDAPVQATLDRSNFETKWYRLNLPPTVVTVSNVTGSPMVEYQLSIPALKTDQSTTTFLDPSMNGEVALEMQQWRFAPEEIDQEKYRGELIILYRGSNGADILYRGNVTIEVRG